MSKGGIYVNPNMSIYSVMWSHNIVYSYDPVVIGNLTNQLIMDSWSVVTLQFESIDELNWFRCNQLDKFDFYEVKSHG